MPHGPADIPITTPVIELMDALAQGHAHRPAGKASFILMVDATQTVCGPIIGSGLGATTKLVVL